MPERAGDRRSSGRGLISGVAAMSGERDAGEIALVVGIGASAGGLEALKEFFEELPPSSGFAFVVVQHLDPTHASMLAEILDRNCHLSVTEAVHGERLEPDRVYTIPPPTPIWKSPGRRRSRW
jgi:chemotaxis response regulator CheB